MKNVCEKVSVELNASPSRVWEIISAIEGVDKWFPSIIKSCRFEGNKRYCETSEGINLTEDIIEVNHETRTFRFAIPKQEMLPVENIKETMKVFDAADGKTIVEWSGSWNVSEENETIAREGFLGLWNMGLKEMENYISSSN